MKKQDEKIVTMPNLRKLSRSYENKWVALSPNRDKVIASGSSLEETVSRVDEKIRHKAAYSKVQPADTIYAPSSTE